MGKAPTYKSDILELSPGWATNSQRCLSQAPPLSGSQFPPLSNQGSDKVSFLSSRVHEKTWGAEAC